MINHLLISALLGLGLMALGQQTGFASDDSAQANSPASGPTSDTAPAQEEIVGVVKLVGSAFSSKVVITEATKERGKERGEQKEAVLCKNDLSRRISKIPGMSVRIIGTTVEKSSKKSSSTKPSKSSSSNCFKGQQFIVEKTSSGRPAVVGKLKKEGGTYKVYANDGSTKQLQHVSSGLKELENKTVILDINSLSTPPVHQSIYRVVTYSEFPE